MSERFETLRKVYNFARVFLEAMRKRNIGLLSAGVAFFALLALFPGIAALISVFGVFADPLVIQDQLSFFEDFLPPDAYVLLSNQITRLVWANEGALGWASIVSILIALFLARRGVDAMLVGINAIHRTPHRPGWLHALRVLGMTLGMLLAGIVALLSVLVLPVILAIFPLAGLRGIVVELGRWALSLGLVVMWIWLFYWIGPNHEKGTRPPMAPGLTLAMTLWISASVGFSYYLQNFGNYNEVYGSLGAVVALLMWFYISAYAVLIGGVLNATLHDMRARRQSEETRGVTPMSDETAPQATE